MEKILEEIGVKGSTWRGGRSPTGSVSHDNARGVPKRLLFFLLLDVGRATAGRSTIIITITITSARGSEVVETLFTDVGDNLLGVAPRVPKIGLGVLRIADPDELRALVVVLIGDMELHG